MEKLVNISADNISLPRKLVKIIMKNGLHVLVVLVVDLLIVQGEQRGKTHLM